MRPIFILCFLLVPSLAPAASLAPATVAPTSLETVISADVTRSRHASASDMTRQTLMAVRSGLGDMIHEVAGKGRDKPRKVTKGRPDLTTLLPFDRTPAQRPVLPPFASDNSPVHQVPVSPVAAPFIATLLSMFAWPLHHWERGGAGYRRKRETARASRIIRKAPC